MGVGTLLRAQLRADRAVLALFAAVVASAALLAVVLPDQVLSTLDRALRLAVTEAPLRGRELTVGNAEAALSYRELQGMQGRAESLMPAALPVLHPPVQAAYTEALVLHDQPGRPVTAVPAQVAVRYQSGLLNAARFVAGRPPAPSAPGAPVEVAVAASAARSLGLGVGDQAGLRPEIVAAVPTSPSQRRPVVLGPTRITVTGVFEPVQPDSDDWAYDRRVLAPATQSDRSGNTAIRLGTVLTTSSAVDRLARDVGALSYELHYGLDPTTFGAAAAVRVEDVLARAADEVSFSPAQTRPRPYAAGSGSANTSTAAPDTLASFHSAAADARGLAGLFLGGVVALALLAAALVARVFASGRETVLGLLAARGLGRRQTAAMGAAEALIVAAPAAVAGQLAGGALTGAFPAVAWAPLAATVASAVVLVSLAVSAAMAGRQQGRWRPALVLATAAVAGLALYSLRRRGVTGPAHTGTDWVLIGTPALLAAAAGMVTAALHRYPLRLGTRLARGGRGAVAQLALSRARRDGTGSALVLAALVMAVALSAYAVLIQTALSAAHTHAAWTAVGADYRLDAPDPFQDFETRFAAVDGVTGAAGAAVVAATAGGDDGPAADVRVVAVDTRRYQAAFAHEDDAPTGLARLVDPGPLPAFGNPDALSLATSGRLALAVGNAKPITLDLAALGDRQAPIASAGASTSATASLLRPGLAVVLLDLPALQDATGTTFDVNRLFIAAGPALADELAAAAPEGATVQDRLAARDRVAGAPLTSGIRDALLLGVLAAAAYALLLFVAGLALNAPSRGRDLARLRTLGATARQTTALLRWEVWPQVAVATCAGALAGLALAHAVAPAVDLTPYTGGGAVPRLRLPALQAAAVAGAAVSVACLAVLITRLLDRHRDVGAALRLGEP